MALPPPACHDGQQASGSHRGGSENATAVGARCSPYDAYDHLRGSQYQGNAGSALASGADYLLAYRFGRYYGVITPDM